MHVTNSGFLASITGKLDLGSASDAQTIFAKIQLAQAEKCKQLIESIMHDVEEIQSEEKACDTMIEKARELQSQAQTSGADTEIPADMVQYFKDHGLSCAADGSSNTCDAAQWDTNLKSLTIYQNQLADKAQPLINALQNYTGQYSAHLQDTGGQPTGQ